MKRLLFITAFFLTCTQLLSGQCLKSECMISIHTIEYAPNAGYDMSDIYHFLDKELYPAFAKELDCEISLIKGLNRENKNKVGVVYYYTSKQHFNKFWNDDGSPTDKGQKAIDNIEPFRVEFRELGSFETTDMQDWTVL